MDRPARETKIYDTRLGAGLFAALLYKWNLYNRRLVESILKS